MRGETQKNKLTKKNKQIKILLITTTTTTTTIILLGLS
jgi:hypothetical protein